MNQTSFEVKSAEEDLPTTRKTKDHDGWLMVAVCSGAIVLPEKEMANFFSGYGTAILWLSIPTAIAALVFAFLG